jgi:hypothetical protein
MMEVRSGAEIEFIKPAGKIINDLMPPNIEVEETVLVMKFTADAPVEMPALEEAPA